MPEPTAAERLPTIYFGGFLDPDQVVGDYAAVASFLVGGEVVLVTVSVTLAAVMAGRVGHGIDWRDYPPLAALGYQCILDVYAGGLSASEIPLTGDDADALLQLDRAWWESTRA